MVQINGENYRVRTRDVDGKKQQIYYKDGQAYIKDSNGNLQAVKKTSDGVFKKASYETSQYTYEQMTKEVQAKNENAVSGKLSPDVHYTSDLAIGKTATFNQKYSNSAITGKIILREGDGNNPVAEPVLVNERVNSYNGRTATTTKVYGFNYAQTNADATVSPLEETTVMDDGTVLSKTVYDWSANPATKTSTILRDGKYITETTYFNEGYQSFRPKE